MNIIPSVARDPGGRPARPSPENAVHASCAAVESRNAEPHVLLHDPTNRGNIPCYMAPSDPRLEYAA